MIGSVAFFIIVGFRVLDPTYLAWVEIDNDPLMGYLGSAFYRSSPWNFPIGLNPQYGLDIASSIVYSDSVSLMAILLKPFANFLPSSFQYFGWWIFICFLMQALFGWLLVSLSSAKIFFKVFATAIFMFIPIMLDRIGMHAGLVAQFMILAALYLNFKTPYKPYIFYWSSLLFLAPLIHFYLLIYVMIIWGASIIDALYFKAHRISYSTAVTKVIVGLFFTFFAMWQAGYFAIPTSSAGNWGYGTWPMNMLSFFNGLGWSYVLPSLPSVTSLGNRFQYPGLGVFILIIFAIYKVPEKWKWLSKKLYENIFLIISLPFLFVFALTNYVSIGPLFYYFELPQFLLTLGNSFRGSDRMFWPILYLIVFSAMAIIARSYSSRSALAITAIACLVQVLDTSAGGIPLHARINSYNQSLAALPLEDKFWDLAAKKYQSVIIINDGKNSQENWTVFSRYALANHLKTNAAVFARVDLKKAEKMVASFRNDQLRADSLYIVSDYELPRYVTKIDKEKDLLAEINGFNVIAPGWNKCIECTELNKSMSKKVYGIETIMDVPIPFSPHNLRSTSYLIDGWSPIIEGWGVWSNDSHARITIPIPRNTHPAYLKLFVRAYVNGLNPIQEVAVSVNGKKSKRFIFNQFEINEIKIPLDNAVLLDGFVNLIFQFPNAKSPKSLGVGDDDRNLAIGLRSAIFTK